MIDHIKIAKNLELILKEPVKYIDKMFKFGNEFLIDRADLSKGISIEKIPAIQKKILTKARKKGKNIYIATNFLESMVQNFVPAVNEANDIYSSLDSGAKGLVLAAETAIGKYPKECVGFLKKQIKFFIKNN